MMLIGVGLGFAKGLPVNQERELGAKFVSKTPIKVETFYFDSKEEMEEFLEARCYYYEEGVVISSQVQTDGNSSIRVVTIQHYTIYAEWDC